MFAETTTVNIVLLRGIFWNSNLVAFASITEYSDYLLIHTTQFIANKDATFRYMTINLKSYSA